MVQTAYHAAFTTSPGGLTQALGPMSSDIAAALVTASGAIILAGATYWLTKKQEREAELRKEKLGHYKEFATSLSGIVSGEWTSDSQRQFALACNKLNLVAPQAVLVALQEFQRASQITAGDQLRAKHDELMSNLFYEMRRDLGMSPADDPETFRIGLWSSGQSSGP